MLARLLGISVARTAWGSTTIRRLGVAALGLGLGTFSPGSPAAADDFEVTRTDDPAPAACVSGVSCSLREAVIAANALGGTNRILLPAGTYALSIAGSGEDLSATGDLDLLSGYFEIRGMGDAPADTVVDATGLGDRILDALPSADALILNLTLRGGNEVDGGAIRSVRELTIRRVVFDRNHATGRGGAIHSSDDNARVTIEDSTFSGNSSEMHAGAIWNEDASTFVVARSTFTGNVAAERGGAIYNQENGAFTLSDCLLEGNRAEDAGEGEDGGAIFTQNTSSFTIVRSQLLSNLAEEAGGAIFVQNDSALTIVDSVIHGNTALGIGTSDGGGAIYANNDSALLIERSTISGNHSDGDAGAISRNNDGQLLMRNSTVSGNTAGGNGGGLVFDSAGTGGFIALESCTVTDNAASGLGGGVYHEGDPLREAGFQNTIVADNFAGGVPNDCATDGFGVFTSHGFNLDTTGTCGLGAATDLPATVALLGPLGDHGGPTATHLPLVGSPAIDAGTTDPLGPSVDQRGVARPQGVRRDIGAVERVGEAPSSCTGVDATVADWKSQVPQGECADPGEAERICRAWLKSCETLVRAAAKCRTTELGGAAKLEKATCKTASVADPNQCKEDVNAELGLQKGDVKLQRAAGLQACGDHVDDCVLLCGA